MDIRSLQRQWDRFGRKDPLWAVLSVPDKRHGRWQEDEFFATGQREIQETLRRAGDLGVAPARERALDFGCGVGRLSQALAEVFTSCDGVDIAPSMIEAARRYNRKGERCRYHVNERPDLGLFPDSSFSFVYSNLVLQHMRPELSRGYIGEFLRVLAPAGLLVFHIPSEPFPMAAGKTRSACGRALPPSGFRAGIALAETAIERPAGTPVTLKVTLTNASPIAWPCLGRPSPLYQITLGNHWLDAAGALVTLSDGRSPLPHDLPAGQSVELFLRVTLPAEPGSYWLELDVVQEGVAWFAQHGSPTLRVHCLAQGEGRAASTRVAAAAPTGPPAPSFRERHPRLHFLLARVLRLPALAGALSRAAQRALWHAHALRQIVADRTQRALEPPMEMNGIPREEVLRLIAAAGGRVVDVEDAELTDAGWQAYRYWVTRKA